MDFGGNRGLDSRPGAEALDRRLHIHNVFKDILIFYVQNIFASIFNSKVQLQISSQTVSILKFLFKMRLGNFKLESKRPRLLSHIMWLSPFEIS